jgi:alpha-ketoglutarate-dependent taurine dioxygenase
MLFRGTGATTAATFQPIAEALCERLVDYVYRSTPRTTRAAHVYTATEYRADADIPLHHENAYQRDWPMKLIFCCTQPAASGGETPLARSADVIRRLDASLVQTFRERRITYVRNYGHGVDLSWQTTFQTDSQQEVEAYCAREGLEFAWLPGGRLRTRQTCDAVARHPMTGEEIWFNQAHLFHVSSLGRENSREMLELFDEQDLPRHACFGDGSALDELALEQIRGAYAGEAVSFTWQAGDVLLVDNMLVAHGRRPFSGARQVLVAMGDPFSEQRRP